MARVEDLVGEYIVAADNEGVTVIALPYAKPPEDRTDETIVGDVRMKSWEQVNEDLARGVVLLERSAVGVWNRIWTIEEIKVVGTPIAG